MPPKHHYRRLLGRMRLIERIGESLYTQLAAKEEDAALRDVFRRLADNERTTGNRIQDELGFPEGGLTRKSHGWIVKVATLLFKMAPRDLMLAGLRRVLDRGMFQQWFEAHHSRHPAFWQSVLDHEKLQKDLLIDHRR